MPLMEKNEIKKRLYKEDPKAYFVNARKDGLLYEVKLLEEQHPCAWDQKLVRDAIVISFFIPLGEIGEVIWKQEMDAKLLIRWLQD